MSPPEIVPRPRHYCTPCDGLIDAGAAHPPIQPCFFLTLHLLLTCYNHSLLSLPPAPPSRPIPISQTLTRGWPISASGQIVNKPANYPTCPQKKRSSTPSRLESLKKRSITKMRSAPTPGLKKQPCKTMLASRSIGNLSHRFSSCRLLASFVLECSMPSLGSEVSSRESYTLCDRKFILYHRFNRSGGGMQDKTTVNNGNVALYSTFAVFGFFGGTICNKIGPRVTL